MFHCYFTVDGSEIWRSPVEVSSFLPMICKVLAPSNPVALGFLNHGGDGWQKAAMASGASMHQASLCVGEVKGEAMGCLGGDTPTSTVNGSVEN